MKDKPWVVIDDDNTFHITPVKDLKEHLQESYYDKKQIVCDCDCSPKIEVLDDRILIVHKSFDGRENFELDNDVCRN